MTPKKVMGDGKSSTPPAAKKNVKKTTPTSDSLEKTPVNPVEEKGEDETHKVSNTPEPEKVKPLPKTSKKEAEKKKTIFKPARRSNRRKA